MLALLIAHHGLAFLEHDQTLGLGKLVAGLEVEQQIAAQPTPSFEAHCNAPVPLNRSIYIYISDYLLKIRGHQPKALQKQKKTTKSESSFCGHLDI